MIGRTLAHYEIVEKLGSGGMGDVYLAKDTKLDRNVALKILPTDSATRDRLRRFEQEAKAVAALNHPNIVHLYSVEEVDEIHFITMEWVQGKTLKASIPSKGLPLSKFLDIAIPIVDAVSAAHEQGVIHRDLKPDNVVLSDDGRVKVLDFGLAKLRPDTDGVLASESPTLSATDDGHVVGTVAYMSPEQAEGKSVDHRTDIFSLGIVMHEMLTGKRPFEDETPAAMMSAIIKDAAPAPSKGLPRDVARILKRCLTKDVSRRFHSAADLRNDLEDVKEALGSGDLHEAQPTASETAGPWIAAGAVAVVLTIIGLAVIGDTPESTGIQLTNPAQLTAAVGIEDYPTWSADGQRVAYHSDETGNWDIWVTQLGGGDAVNFTVDNEGTDRFPSWSPDGRQIAFMSRREETWSVYTISSLGGTLRKWIELDEEQTPMQGRPQWSADGTELAVSVEEEDQNFVDIVNLSTQQIRRVELPRPEGKIVIDLSSAPNGNVFAYVSANTSTAEITQLLIFNVTVGELLMVTDGTTNDWHPTWSRDGDTLFFVSNRGGSMDLWQQSLAPNGAPEGEAKPLTSGMGIRSAVFAPSGDKIAYSRGRTISNVWRVPLRPERRATWADAEPLTSDNAFAENVSLAPDGTILFSSDRSGNQDLWSLSAVGETLKQLTFDSALQTGPSVSPDGTEVAFYGFQDGSRDIMVMPIEGGPIRTLAPSPGEDIVPRWSPDGSEITFVSRRSGERDVWVVDAAGGEPRQVMTSSGRTRGAPSFSPDGEWIYFRTGLERPLQIWRVPSIGGEPERVTQAQGFTARFSRDGRVLYFPQWGETDVWAKSLEDGREYPVTDFAGRPGKLGWDLDTDDDFLYFTWWEPQGDIWVMDVEASTRR